MDPAFPLEFPRPWGPGRMALAALSGALVVLAFPLFGDRFGLDHLIWVALVPLFAAALGVGWKKGLALGWTAGMTLEGAGFIWILYAIRSFTEVGAVLSSFAFLVWLLYAAIPWALLGLALGRVRENRQLLWVLPLWVGIEHFYPRLFPWHLGGALYARTHLLQNADLLGASGLTALVFLTSVAAYRLLQYLRGRDRLPVATIAASIFLVAAALVYGKLRLAAVEDFELGRQELRVGLVQPAIDPRDENRKRRSLEIHLERTEEMLSSAGPLDLVVWPEGADPHPFILEPRPALWQRHFERESAALLSRLRNLRVPLLGGGVALEYGPDGRARDAFGIAFYLPPKAEPMFYKKNYRMPFGENLLVLEILPESWRTALALPGRSITAGTENPPLRLGGHTFRNLICYEAVLPSYVRRSSRGADFLVNITEDYWYGRTGHVPQHVSVLILRAVETRVPIVRSTNAGPSGVIRASGRFEQSDKVFEPDLLVVSFAPGRPGSFHQATGHWFPLLALVAGVALQLRIGSGGRKHSVVR
jgi:apolipoprotein N-acyltransferase